MRYSLLPSLISAGHSAVVSGFPIVARCDLFWPKFAEAASNHQYIWLNDTLVAPIWDSSTNASTRKVWIPPGDWQDGWDGSTVTGPKAINVTQPFDRIPMWHRKGGLVVAAPDPGLRVDEQDWETLLLHAFPGSSDGSEPSAVRRTVKNRGDLASAQHIDFATDGNGKATFILGAPEDGTPRAFVLRLNLKHGEQVQSVSINGNVVDVTALASFTSSSSSDQHFPFQGLGSSPAPLAGDIVEVPIRSSHIRQTVDVTIA